MIKVDTCKKGTKLEGILDCYQQKTRNMKFEHEGFECTWTLVALEWLTRCEKISKIELKVLHSNILKNLSEVKP